MEPVMNANNNIPAYFFLGIGGIGMSALARLLLSKQQLVFGFDRTQTSLTNALENEGAKIYYAEEDVIEKLSKFTTEEVNLIYTPAIAQNSDMLKYVYERGFKIQKRATLLGELIQKGRCLAVAGTHGKTTTSAILTHLFIEAKIPFTAFLGGILNGINSNFYSTGSEVYVVEADEFDRSFLQLKPHAAVVTSMDADHLDIYGSVEKFEEGFREFASKVKHQLWVNENISLKGNSIGFNPTSQAFISNIRVENACYIFDVQLEGVPFKNINFSLPGRHNLFNALAALCLAVSSFPDKATDFTNALASFPGVKRRFNYLLKSEQRYIIDDYAHHPTEVLAAYQGAREMHPNERLMVIFQPHLFSRTENFVEDFARALGHFDEICLLEIYPARELPIEGVNAAFLCNKIDAPHKKVISKNEIINEINASQCRVVLLLGAGDIGVEANHVKQYFTNEAKLA
jgi:UDP-N-acetylmuramate--alanine ligase